MCKAQKRTLESKGAKFPEGYCVFNKEGGGECKYPLPELNPLNFAVAKLYDLTYGATIYAGMDGVETGKDMSSVRAIAEAMCIPWDQTTVEKFSLIEMIHLKESHRQREANRKK